MDDALDAAGPGESRPSGGPDGVGATHRGRWHEVRLPFRAPLPLTALIEFLGDRAIPGVEQVVDGSYSRVVRGPGGLAVMSLGPGRTSTTGATGDGLAGSVACRVRLDEPRDLPVVVSACRRLLDLDADPVAIDADLSTDPLLAPLVAAMPGRRAPVHVDAGELAVRAVLGQQVSLKAARLLAGRLTALCGQPLATPVGDLTTAFPTSAAIADADLDQLGMPGSRRATLRTLARALAVGEVVLDPAGDHDEAEHKLLELRGIGPWTASYIRMRGLGDPDVFLAGDVGVRHGLARLGIAEAAVPDEWWRPWRSYVVHHLWASLSDRPATRDA